MNDIIEKQNEQGEVFLRINKKAKKGWYKILPHSSQSKYCERVDLIGFVKLPSGFYTNDGIGLTAAGVYLLQELSEKYKNKKVRLTIVNTGKPSLDGRGKHVKAILPHSALSSVNADVRATKQARNEEIRAEVKAFLAKHYKNQFRHYQGYKPEYAPGSLAEVLKQEKLIAKLGTDDRQILEEFIPEYLKSIEGTLRAKKKLKIIFDALDAGKKVYLEKVIKEFKSKLKRKVQNEQIWQDFLSENILVLRSSYGEVLEKQSVSLQGKFPDFMLLDPYGYLDVYEIKKPTTPLLKYDKGRNNYYWDVEMSKAIAQTENYLHQIQRNSDSLINDIRRNKGIEVSIVRPKGYIVSGTRNQLTSTKMVDDFRILSESLKNIDILLYDDLLQNLESFVAKMASA